MINLTITATQTDDLRDRIFFAMADRRYAVLSMDREEATLEKIFLALTEEAEAEKKRALKKDAEPERDGEYELIEEEKEEG